jgi:outer membrane protein assembly factor BamB
MPLRHPVVSDGFVYVGSRGSSAYCFDASDGTKIWNFTAEAHSEAPFQWVYRSSAPAVGNGNVYFGSENYYFYCLDAASGNEVWKFLTGAEVFASPTITKEHVLVSSNDGNVYCLEASSGNEVWRIDAGVYSPVTERGSSGSAVVANNMVYVIGNGVISAWGTQTDIPEFSSWIILPILLMGTLVVVELKKKLKQTQ